MSDKPKRPQPLTEEGLRRALGGVGPLSPDDVAAAGRRIVIDLGQPPSKSPPRRKGRGA